MSLNIQFFVTFSAPLLEQCLADICVDVFAGRSYKFSRTCSSKSLPKAIDVFTTSLIEHLEIVVVQHGMKQVTLLSLVDAPYQTAASALRALSLGFSATKLEHPP